MKLAIIGAGTIGRVHAQAAVAAGIRIAWIADPVAAQASRLCQDVGAARHTEDPQTALADGDVDAVIVAVPNRFHKDLAIAAMRAGKDVLLEKPMGLDAAQCREINNTARQTGRIVQIGMANRFTAVGRGAKQVMESDELGRVYHARASLYMRRGIPGLGGWFTTKATAGGGVLIDNGVHLIDLVLWLLGFPRVERISGRVESTFGAPIKDYVYEAMWGGPPRLDGTFDVEDSAHALFRLAGGVTFDLALAWAINVPKHQESRSVTLFGDRGGLAFDLFGDCLHVSRQEFSRNVDARVALPPVDAFAEQLQAFARCVATRTPPAATGAQGEAVSAAIDAIYQSSQANREVELLGAE